jgi:hypothetical protein
MIGAGTSSPAEQPAINVNKTTPKAFIITLVRVTAR